MASVKDIAAIQRCLSNRVDDSALGQPLFAAVIGDSPSHYSKSPQLWNAAFQHLHIDAAYAPFDVDADQIGELLGILKNAAGFLGANVTVPHKVRIMDFLDSVDVDAERIDAVNTIVKTAQGELIGYNTDGAGFVQSILKRQPDRLASFVESLEGLTVLLIGAGGSARAVAIHVGDRLEAGKLLISNRTKETAASLAREIRRTGKDALAVGEEELALWATRADLIINSTTKGQGGFRRMPNGTVTFLEPYSALAPAHPPVLTAPDVGRAGYEEQWRKAADADIESNNESSMKLAQSVPPHAGFYDLIYHPEETVFLRHGRSTGHRTMNGKAMIINQAALAFCERICKAELRARAIDTPQTHDEILAAMYSAW